jgi:transposase
VEATLARSHVKGRPKKLVGERAYDSDKLNKRLLGKGIRMVSPHRGNRRPENKTQDGRELWCYLRRWKVERLFAWLGNFRRILVRHEFKPESYHAFVQLGAVMILLRYF